MADNIEKSTNKLIALGKERGYVTYDELNQALPSESVSSESIEDAISQLNDLSINVSESDREGRRAASNQRKKKTTGPDFENPLSKEERTLLLKWSRLAKEQNLLRPPQRRYLFFGGKYDKWFRDLPNKLSNAVTDLEQVIDAGDEDALKPIQSLSAHLNYCRAEQLAEEGVAHAQNTCGLYWYFGLHNDENHEKAAYWYGQAAEQGDREAQGKLGVMYYYGEGLTKNTATAIEWCQKAVSGNQMTNEEECDQEVEGLCYAILGACYLFGDEVESDPVKAVELLTTASEKDDELGQYLLSRCYFEGRGVERDVEASFNLAQKSAEQDYQPAIEDLVQMFREGIGTPLNLSQAEHWTNRLEEPTTDEGKYDRAVLNQSLKEAQSSNTSNEGPEPQKVSIAGHGNVYEHPRRHLINTKSFAYVENDDLEQLIRDDEGDQLEFKSSLRYDWNLKKTNRNLELVIVKGVAGLLNKTGGTLIIGVNDKQKVIGLEEDLNTFANEDEPDRNLKDRYLLHLRGLLKDCLEIYPALQQVRADFKLIDNREVCVIKVEAGSEPVEISLKKLGKNHIKSDPDGKTAEQIKAQYEGAFFVRDGNRTVPLTPGDAAKYARQNWPATTRNSV